MCMCRISGVMPTHGKVILAEDWVAHAALRDATTGAGVASS